MQGHTYRLSLLKIPVSDIERSAAFYCDSLGFQSTFVAAEYGWAQLQAGDLPLALYQPGMGGGDGPIGGSVDFHLVLPAGRFDALAPGLQQRGVLVEDMIHRSDDGGTLIDVRDPDGNVLKIVRDPGT